MEKHFKNANVLCSLRNYQPVKSKGKKSNFWVPKVEMGKIDDRRHTWIENMRLKSGGAESDYSHVRSDHFVKSKATIILLLNFTV